jgi:hypothetical protein
LQIKVDLQADHRRECGMERLGSGNWWGDGGRS